MLPIEKSKLILYSSTYRAFKFVKKIPVSSKNYLDAVCKLVFQDSYIPPENDHKPFPGLYARLPSKTLEASSGFSQNNAIPTSLCLTSS
jgi:hypothetical protein